MSADSTFDRQQLRRIFGRWATGVAVISTCDADGEPRGLTVNSFSSVSLDPPLILWSIAKSAQSAGTFVNGRRFAVNILSQDDEALARHFAKSGGTKFAEIPHSLTTDGIPVLPGNIGTIHCEVNALHDGGDHSIIVGRVLALSDREAPPLLFSSGAFTTLPHATGAPSGAALLIVGNEILSGSVADTNAPFVASCLENHGLPVREIRVLPDEPQAIAAAIRAARRRRQWVVVTGGLGPTPDDVTAAGVALALHRTLVTHEAAVACLEQHHAPGSVPVARLTCARLPEGSTALPELISGSCGFLVDNIIALPGAPELVRHLIDGVLAQIAGGPPSFETCLRVTCREEDITATLHAAQQRHPSLSIGSYPYYGSDAARVNIVVKGQCKASVSQCGKELADALGTGHTVETRQTPDAA